MSDFFADFKQKINNSLQSVGASESIANKPQSFRIRGRQIQEDKLITEGAFGYIWRAHDIQTQEVFALKRMMCMDSERLEIAQQEIDMLEQLPQSENIVGYYGSEMQPYQGGKIVVILLELCSGGSLFDLLEKKQQTRFQEREIINIALQMSQGINSMHQLTPPLAHRDIKLENVLQGYGNQLKLCDFGSASTQRVDFSKINKNDFVDYEEVFEKTTTPMYRPPEMADPYLGFYVNEKVDIWMVGCVIYTLAYYIHPFIEGQKIGICQAAYTFPDSCRFSEKFRDLIRHLLTPNPKFRPNIVELLYILKNWNSNQPIQLNQEAQKRKLKDQREEQEERQFNQNKKQIKKFDGDIPIEELMKAQNQIRKNNNREEEQSFSDQRAKKLQEQQKIALQQKQRMIQQKQQKQSQQNQQKNNNTNNNSSANNTFQNWENTNTNTNNQQKNTQNTAGWDNCWGNDTATTNQNNNNNNKNNQQQQQQGDIWDVVQQPKTQQQQNKSNNNNNQQQQSWDSNNWGNTGNNNNSAQNQNQAGWDNCWDNNSQNLNNNVEQKVQQQYSNQQNNINNNNNNNNNCEEDLLGMGDTNITNNNNNKDYDLSDIQF